MKVAATSQKWISQGDPVATSQTGRKKVAKWKCDILCKVTKRPHCDVAATSHLHKNATFVWKSPSYLPATLLRHRIEVARRSPNSMQRFLQMSPCGPTATSLRHRIMIKMRLWFESRQVIYLRYRGDVAIATSTQKGQKSWIFEVARHISVTATEDAPWIFEVFIADHCAFVRLRLTEIYGNLYTRQTSNCRARISEDME